MSWTFRSVAIIGAGAIGLYYGARLAAAGRDVRFLLRSDYDAVKDHGMRVHSIHGDFELPQAQVFRSTGEIGPVDLVIVAWKTTSNAALAELLPPLMHDQTQVLTLQNGLGNCELLEAIVGPQRVLGGLCFVCINRIASGEVSHTSGGKISVGEWVPDERGRAAEIARVFNSAGIPAIAAESLPAAQWEKLVWNIPFNGLAIAEGGVTTDVLLGDPAIEAEIRALMAEVIAAARAQGLALDDALIEHNIGLTRPMDAYKPSSMIDYVEGREVESEAIWAEPLRRAKAAGVDARHLEKLLERIERRIAERDSSWIRPAQP